ncbi:MAG: CRP/FNR family transcriptional regulator [Cyclobacteriaceae bacterium]|jgi:CRP/FNR family transcriptional regulator
MIEDILAQSSFEQNLIDDIIQVGRLKKIKAGVELISPGSQSNEVPMVIDGLLRVMRIDGQGKEILLYYLEGGETCAMSITCCLEGKINQFKVISEEDTTLWMIPIGSLDSWLERYRSFRKFVFNAYQTRFDELLETIDSVTFLKMDERLYKYLLDQKQATGSFSIHKTHQQIAKELSTSRVVISRLLKQLEREEKIEQYRNKIDIL